MGWDAWAVMIGMVGCISVALVAIWGFHPANEALNNWRRQRDRAKLIRERLK